MIDTVRTGFLRLAASLRDRPQLLLTASKVAGCIVLSLTESSIRQTKIPGNSSVSNFPTTLVRSGQVLSRNVHDGDGVVTNILAETNYATSFSERSSSANF